MATGEKMLRTVTGATMGAILVFIVIMTFLSFGVFAQDRPTSDSAMISYNTARIDSLMHRVDALDTLAFEKRMTRMETYLEGLRDRSDANQKLLYSVFGALLIQALKAVYDFVSRKKN